MLSITRQVTVYKMVILVVAIYQMDHREIFVMGS